MLLRLVSMEGSKEAARKEEMYDGSSALQKHTLLKFSTSCVRWFEVA